MNYGILASGSYLLTDIVDRLSRHLSKGIPEEALKAYLAQVKKWCPDQSVIHIDDSDVVKPDGYKFEFLGWVRDDINGTLTQMDRQIFHAGGQGKGKVLITAA